MIIKTRVQLIIIILLNIFLASIATFGPKEFQVTVLIIHVHLLLLQFVGWMKARRNLIKAIDALNREIEARLGIVKN